jgi:type I restriction enzyme R subunit
MIFPAITSWMRLEKIIENAKIEGLDITIWFKHSAGSGKSNSIAWLAHRLATLFDADDQKVFDSVIVVTDRLVLDQQLQNTIYQFEHKRSGPKD